MANVYENLIVPGFWDLYPWPGSNAKAKKARSCARCHDTIGKGVFYYRAPETKDRICHQCFAKEKR